MVVYVFTPHARFEMARRGLPEFVVREVLSAPGQRIEIRPGRVLYQSIVEGPQGAGRRLVRVVVDVDRQPAEVVTAYRTSRIARYWRESTI
jgi:hypothetical protein